MAQLRILVLLTLTGVCYCQPECSYWRLWEYLNLTTSNSFMANVRPVKHWNTPTNVYIDLVLFGILKVDEKSQTVEGATWTTVEWPYDFLKWDPNEFCGIDVITVPRSLLWNPDLYIQEDVSDTSSIKMSPYVNLYWYGRATASIRHHLTFTCQLNLNLFPFDDQNCSITFSSMTSDARALVLTTISNGTQLANTSKSVLLTQGEWELVNIVITEGVSLNAENITRSKLTYNVSVSRRPMLYVINFIFPLCFFLFLDLASFFISESRGEKLGFKITILLSISVLLLILKDLLPSNEKTLPWIANYSVVTFALVGISLLETMIITLLLSFEEKVKDEPQTYSNDEDIQLEKSQLPSELTKADPPPLSDRIQAGILQQILLELQSAREELGHAEVPKTKQRFKKTALIIDRVFFFLYFTAVFIYLTIVYEKWVKRYVRFFM